MVFLILIIIFHYYFSRLIQSALNVIADNIGWNSIPPEFKQRNAAYRLAQGEPMFMCVFIQYLHDLSVKLPQGMSGDVDTDVENALNELRTAASAAEEAWEEPRYLSEQPLSYAEYIALAEGENDSLEGEDELNVVSSSEIRRQRAMGVHKNNKIARPSPASHVRTRTNSNSDNSSSRHTTPPLRFTNSSSSQQSSLQHSTQSQQSQAEILAAAHAATQQRLLLHAKRTAQKATADTTGSSSSSAGGTGSGGAKAKLSLSAPASISVRAGQGLTVGSSMIDPKYQPGGKRIFTETAPEPEPEEPSSSSESEDSIRPIYDPHYTGQKGRGGFGHQQQRHPSMRMPHSKSISPVGRRHLHCQLRDSVHPPVVYRNRSVSPNEARVLRANNQYQQPYRVDVNNMHNAAGYSSAEERIIRHKRLSTENAAYDQQLPHSKQNVHFGTSEIRKKQSKAVLGVFKRNDLQPSSCSKKPGRKDTAIDIDAVITTERKNIILTWIQQHLGICIDTHVNATTSAQYNRSVGKNVVSPDSIAVVPKSEKHTDKGTHSGKKGPQKSPDGEIDKENYYFFPETEDALFIPSRSSNSYGTYSIATYLGKITGGAAAYTANVADQVVAQQQQHQQHQRESVVLQIPEDLEGAAAAAAGSVVASAGKFTGTDHYSFPLLKFIQLLLQFATWIVKLCSINGNSLLSAPFFPITFFLLFFFIIICLFSAVFAAETAPPYVKAPTTSIGFLNDPWVGGLLLSEIVAALSVENRALIKQVCIY